MISSIAYEKRVKLLVSPPLLVLVQRDLVGAEEVLQRRDDRAAQPRVAGRMLRVGWRGDQRQPQHSSCTVFGFPSVSASRIAVIGRQNDQ